MEGSHSERFLRGFVKSEEEEQSFLIEDKVFSHWSNCLSVFSSQKQKADRRKKGPGGLRRGRN